LVQKFRCLSQDCLAQIVGFIGTRKTSQEKDECKTTFDEN
jgi:hypothetical protein